jgi:nicotinate dehydrogenase subunit B
VAGWNQNRNRTPEARPASSAPHCVPKPEEVAFDHAKVTSTDWLSYPILDITEAPETVDIVLLNRPELPPAGAGESSIRPVAAALANAVFDATGVRLRRAPLTPERLKPALA